MNCQNKETLISLNGISVSWNEQAVLSDVNFAIAKGDFVAITGPNGGGKTTLIRIILKLLKPSSGTVTK